MGNNYFKFKQFTIQQSHAAMKVGTDGVLLGAWTEIPSTGKILDIGSGTGLIALMLAQRNQNIHITAIEIDKNAALEATLNVKNSNWNHRIEVIETAFQTFARQHASKFDLIVSNPPFFNTSKPSPDKARNMARQTSQLPLNELFSFSNKLLTPDGKLSLILPYELLNQTKQMGEACELFPKKITMVKPTPEKPPHRFLAQFTHEKKEPEVDEIVIESNGRHQYSKEYKQLTADFYLEKT